MNTTQILAWARALQAMAQNGLEYCKNEYDRLRYQELQKTSAEMIAEHSNLTSDELLTLYADQIGYATPKVDVRGAIFRDNKVLLASELMDEGRWTLPGGWADVNDTPSEAVLREVVEETGYEVKLIKLIAVLDREKQGNRPPLPFHVYKHFFLCEIIGGSPNPDHEHEIGEVRFFDLDALPELSISRTTEAQLRLCYEHFLNPDSPTAFD